jgi:hypothetical protein
MSSYGINQLFKTMHESLDRLEKLTIRAEKEAKEAKRKAEQVRRKAKIIFQEIQEPQK